MFDLSRHYVSIACAAILFLLLMSAHNTVFAQEVLYDTLADDSVVGDFVVTPARIEASLAPGASETVYIALTNRTGQTQTFSLGAEDVAGTWDIDQTVVLLGDTLGPYSLKEYITMPTEVTVPHATRARVPVTITVPYDAEPGGLYGSVLFSLEPAVVTGASGVVTSRIGALLFVRVAGDVVEDGALQEFSIKDDQQIFSKTPVVFELLFENNGTVHLNPYGLITVTDMFGNTVAEHEVEPWFVLPDALRLREVPVNMPLVPGRYTATVRMNRGYGDVVDEAAVHFWILPNLVIMLLGIGVLGVLGGLLYRKK